MNFVNSDATLQARWRVRVRVLAWRSGCWRGG